MNRSEFHACATWDWRRVQAAADLKSLIAPHRTRLIAAMTHEGGPAELIADRIGDFLDRPGLTLDPNEGPFCRVWLDAVLENPDLAPDLLQPALAAAFAATILDLWDPAAIAALWHAHHARIVTYPPAERAAFICALRDLLTFAEIEIDPALDPNHCLTQSRESVCAPLRTIAQNATNAELHAIACADYHNSVEKHLAALTEVITSKNCVIHNDVHGTWYPLEVVQLRSHCPDEKGHLVATAVVLITAAYNGDMYSDAEFRWSRQHKHYLSSPAKNRDAILAAIRFCYESSIDFKLTDSFDAQVSDLIPPATAMRN